MGNQRASIERVRELGLDHSEFRSPLEVRGLEAMEVCRAGIFGGIDDDMPGIHDVAAAVGGGHSQADQPRRLGMDARGLDGHDCVRSFLRRRELFVLVSGLCCGSGRGRSRSRGRGRARSCTRSRICKPVLFLVLALRTCLLYTSDAADE